MKKIPYLLLLTALFLSCSSEDDNDSYNSNQNEKSTIDEKIIGKWKVDYSKTIEPAIYIDNQEELAKAQEDSSIQLHLGLNYPDDARVTEYMGDFDGTQQSLPKSGLFDSAENIIVINKDNTIDISKAGVIKKMIVSYKIENGYLKWQTSKDNPTVLIKYKLEEGNLIMELVKAEGSQLFHYTISKYSKIIE